jgi:hypothetical protein
MSDHGSHFIRENFALFKEYVELRLELVKLQGVRMASRSLSILVTAFVVSMLALFILLFLGLTFSAWISSLTGSVIFGYLATAGAYLLLLILVVLLRKPLLQNPLIRLFIQENLHDHGEDTVNDPL